MNTILRVQDRQIRGKCRVAISNYYFLYTLAVEKLHNWLKNGDNFG